MEVIWIPQIQNLNWVQTLEYFPHLFFDKPPGQFENYTYVLDVPSEQVVGLE